MMDLIKTLDARGAEISDYISSSNQEREQLISRLSELDQGVASAEQDRERIRRAMKALQGDDEPTQTLRGAVEAMMPTVPGYRPLGGLTQ